jgi:tetratricopeptide (TPR) repeat protein
MKMKSMYMTVAAMLVAFTAITAWPQATLSRVNGKVTDAGKPIAGAQIVFTNIGTGKTFKDKTGKDGSYNMVGLERTDYQIEVSSPTGEALYKVKRTITAEGGSEQTVNIDISSGSGGGGTAGQPKMTKEQIEALKQQNAKAEGMNALIAQAQTAVAAKNNEAAIPVLTQLTTMDPNRWQFFSALAQAHFNLAQYDDAIASYEKGIAVAQNIVSGSLKDPKNPDADPVKAKAGLAQMLQQEGNSYLKLKKNPEAIAAFEKAAAMDPNPGTAYFNICATQYNTGNTNGAVEACNKAIAADPTRADAYFIKGSLMVGLGTQGKDGKYNVPEGTAEALNKYLELAPDGPHAKDVKDMLEVIGAKIDTNYKAKKK